MGRLAVTCGLLLSVLVPAATARAQAVGDPRAGLEAARSHCAGCHAVESGNRESPKAEAPAFQVIAEVPGVSPIALNVMLKTAHRTMPNIVLQPDLQRDVVAYILSLQ